MTQSTREILRELAKREVRSAALALYFDGGIGLVVRRGRDPMLAKALDQAIESYSSAGNRDTVEVAPIAFAPIPGFAAREIGFTRQDKRSRLAWLRQGLRSGVYPGALRGVAGVVVGPGESPLAVLGQTCGVGPLLVAARGALRQLTSRSNRGELVGPYWYRGRGTGIRELLPRPHVPSTLEAFFPKEGKGDSADEC
jgi:hypothetical protein